MAGRLRYLYMSLKKQWLVAVMAWWPWPQAGATAFEVDGINCQRMLVQMARADRAVTETRALFRPVAGRRFVSTKMTEVLHVAYLLPTILDTALQFGDFTAPERELVRKIRAAMPFENRVQNVRFLSAKQSPQRFAQAGQHRLAVTGNEVGDPIYVNLDHLASLRLDDMVALLVHEFGHHHKMRDDELRFLDQLGSKVATVIRAERADLRDLGLENFTYTKFELKMPSFNISDAWAESHSAEPLHPLDTDFGTHLILSDGRINHDVRELLRLHLSPRETLLDLHFVPLGWRLDGERGLVLRISTRQRFASQRNEIIEVIFPIRAEQSIDRFGAKPYVVDVGVAQRPPLVDWLWRDAQSLPEGAQVSQRVKLIHSEGGLSLDFEYEGLPFKKFPHLAALHWVQEYILPTGELVRARLPSTHPLSTIQSGEYSVEDLGPSGNRDYHRMRFRSKPQHVAPLSGDLKLGAVVLWPFIDHAVAVVPEFIPTLAARVMASDYQVLRHVEDKVQYETLSRSVHSLRMFDLDVVIPDDFPIQTAADLQKFASVDPYVGDIVPMKEHSIITIFADPERPLTRGTGADFRISLGFDVFMGAPEYFKRGVVGGKQRVIRLPLRLGIVAPLLSESQGHQESFNAWTMPETLKINGLIFRTPDLRSWYLPKKIEIRFRD